MNNRRLCLVAYLLLAAATTVHAQYPAPIPVPTVITTAPYTINAPGYYVLGADLVYSGSAQAIITINASNTTLDFNGHYISGPSNTPNTPLYGVYSYEKGNLNIRNGTIAFCYVGVFLDGNDGANSININQRVDNMLISYCYTYGFYAASGRNSEVTRCRLSFTGGGSFQGGAYGIYFNGGTGNNVNDNTLTNTATASGAYAIIGSGGSFSARGNTISNVTASASGGAAVGISAGLFVTDNTISNAKTGIDGGVVQRNRTKGCTAGLVNTSNAGDNFSF